MLILHHNMLRPERERERERGRGLDRSSENVLLQLFQWIQTLHDGNRDVSSGSSHLLLLPTFQKFNTDDSNYSELKKTNDKRQERFEL